MSAACSPAVVMAYLEKEAIMAGPAAEAVAHSEAKEVAPVQEADAGAMARSCCEGVVVVRGWRERGRAVEWRVVRKRRAER